jgi:hypothetical protein
LADLQTDDDAAAVDSAGRQGGQGGGADPSSLPHWELLHLSAQAPGVKGALAQLTTLDCAHLGLGAEGVEFLVRRLPHLPPATSEAAGAGAASSSRSSRARGSSGGGGAAADVVLKLSLAHNALEDNAPTAKALGQLLQRCPLAALDLGYNELGPLSLLAIAAPLGKVAHARTPVFTATLTIELSSCV